MIIQGQLRKNKFYYLPWLLFAMAIIAGGFLLSKKQEAITTKTLQHTITCGAEQVNEEGKFIENGYIFNNGKTQNDEQAFEGKFSSYITPEQKYSISTKYKEFDRGDEIELSIWVYSSTPDAVFLVATSTQEMDFYHQSNKIYQTKEGWHQKVLTIKIPEDKDLPHLEVFSYFTSDTYGAYVDNFKLVNKTAAARVGEKVILNSNHEVETGLLQFGIKAMDKLNRKRKEALKVGLLVKGDDDWVKAKFKTDKLDEVEVKARLKGDWTDHLKGDFWSYRIKMPSEQAWNRMMTFSLQNPMTRGYLLEWVFHQLLEYEDVLTPRYDFIRLKVNDTPSRTYAYEEHFEKQIAEYKNRREGVIVRYAEDEYWDIRRKDKEHVTGLFHHIPNKDGQATIAPFSDSKIVKNEKLMEQFKEASDLLYGFQQFQLKPDQVFNLDKLAKYYAICEIVKAYHSTIWHNMRYYYNPVTRKLEPIGFDGYTENGVYDWHNNAFFGAYRSTSLKTLAEDPALYLFQDKMFNEKYCHYLDKFSKSEYLNIFLETIEKPLQKRLDLIRLDVPDHDYKISDIYKTSRRIQAGLQASSNISLKAYKENCSGNSCLIKMTNYHTVPLEILGSSSSKKYFSAIEPTLLVYANRRVKAQEFTNLTIPKDHTHIHYKVAGVEGQYYSEIIKWSSPQVKTDNFANNSIEAIPLEKAAFVSSESGVTILSGKYTVTKPILIPANKRLTIEPGTTLDFTNGAYLLSYGAVTIEGTSAQPIVIMTSDKSSQGIHVIEADAASTMRQVQVLGLNTLSENAWQMTGAVTFYESKVDLNEVIISGNLCEDALNLIRTDFSANRLHINNTYADGFDADFCHGKLTNSMFVNTGNDGIDFSGSTINVENLTLENIGDKGISAGEEATLTVKNATIDGAAIGVASKDLSIVELKNITLKNCNKGFAAYQKKPEFGPGTIKVKSYHAEAVKFLQIAENNSVIELPADTQ